MRNVRSAASPWPCDEDRRAWRRPAGPRIQQPSADPERQGRGQVGRLQGVYP